MFKVKKNHGITIFKKKKIICIEQTHQKKKAKCLPSGIAKNVKKEVAGSVYQFNIIWFNTQ